MTTIVINSNTHKTISKRADGHGHRQAIYKDAMKTYSIRIPEDLYNTLKSINVVDQRMYLATVALDIMLKNKGNDE